VYVQSLYTNQRVVLANFRGSNSAPAWSPDGKQLAVVLTRDGSSQIYLVRPDGSELRRLTFSGAIDTEPNFSPDGQSLLFTSDRGGSAQIYRMPVAGGPAQRMTFDEAPIFRHGIAWMARTSCLPISSKAGFILPCRTYRPGRCPCSPKADGRKGPASHPTAS